MGFRTNTLTTEMLFNGGSVGNPQWDFWSRTAKTRRRGRKSRKI